jgi:intein-encoded DNA endonuclease-like protein
VIYLPVQFYTAIKAYFAPSAATVKIYEYQPRNRAASHGIIRYFSNASISEADSSDLVCFRTKVAGASIKLVLVCQYKDYGRRRRLVEDFGDTFVSILTWLQVV